VPHNTITPIARRRGEEYEIDLVLRNNITTDEHPLGVYHPHAEHHNIKKENIGLIEVMGLAVLPARLKAEIEDMKSAILSGTDFSASESRRLIASDDTERFLEMIPEQVREKTLEASRFSQNLPDAALVLFLAFANPDALSESPEMSFDLASRLVNAAKCGKYMRLSDLLAAVSTKKYTDSRIRS
jgi:hypothetical protein